MIFAFVTQRFEIGDWRAMSVRSAPEMQIHVPPAFTEIPAPEVTTIFFLADGRPRQLNGIYSRDDIKMMALWYIPDEVCNITIPFRGFAMGKELDIVNLFPDGRVCIALRRVF